MSGIDEDDGLLEQLAGLRFLARGQMIGDLQRRFEGGRFVPIVSVVQPDDDGRRADDRRGFLRRAEPSGIGELLNAGPDLFEPIHVLRRADEEQAKGPSPVALPIFDHPHAIGGRLRDGEDDALHPAEVRMVFARLIPEKL